MKLEYKSLSTKLLNVTLEAQTLEQFEKAFLCAPWTTREIIQPIKERRFPFTLSTLGDPLSTLGDTLSTLGDTLSTLGDTLSTLEDTLSTLGDNLRTRGHTLSTLAEHYNSFFHPDGRQ